MSRRKTPEEFERELEAKWPGKYEVLGTYVNNSTKIKVRCKECGYEWDVIPNKILHGIGCRRCGGSMRKTTEEFSKEIKEKFAGKVEVIGKYLNAKTKITLKAVECGHIYEKTPDSALSATNPCPICAGRYVRSQADFVRELEEKYPGKYQLLGSFVNMNTLVLVKCLECGTEWNITPQNLIRSRHCPSCAMKSRKEKLSSTTEEFAKKLEARHPGKYEVVGEYERANKKIKIRCKKCGKTREVLPNNILKNKGLCECSIGGSKVTTEEFIKEFNELWPNSNIEVIGEFKGVKSPISVRCKTCGHEWSPIPTTLKKGHGCPKCAIEASKGKYWTDTEGFKEEVKAMVGDEFRVISEYCGTLNKIKMLHVKCGNKFDVTPHDFGRNHGCPICNESSGELYIRTLLSKVNVRYVGQYRIPECKNKVSLPFDFAVFSEDKRLLGLIEYDGRQHYKAIDIFGGEKEFNSRLERDEIKNKYCGDNKIPLLRIPYTYSDEEVKSKTIDFLKEIGAIG